MTLPVSPFADEVWLPIECALNDANDVLRCHAPGPGTREEATACAFETNSSSSSALPTRTPSIASPLSKMQWYSHVLNSISKDHTVARELHARLGSWVRLDLQLNVVPVASAIARGDLAGRALIVATAAMYGNFTVLLRFASFVLSYMDKYFEWKPAYPPVRQIFLREFAALVYQPIHEPLVDEVLQQLASLRRASSRDAADIAAVLSCLDLLRVCAEVPLPDGAATSTDSVTIPRVATGSASRSSAASSSAGADNEAQTQRLNTPGATTYRAHFYQRYETQLCVSLAQLSELQSGDRFVSAAEYFDWCAATIAFEESVVFPHLHESCVMDALRATLCTLLPKARCSALLASSTGGVGPLLSTRRFEEMQRIHTLLSRVPRRDGLKLIAEHAAKFVAQRLREELTNGSGCGHLQRGDAADGAAPPSEPYPHIIRLVDKSLVEQLIRCCAALDETIQSAFGECGVVKEAATASMRDVVNGTTSFAASATPTVPPSASRGVTEQIPRTVNLTSIASAAGGAAGASVSINNGSFNVSSTAAPPLGELLASYVDGLMRSEFKEVAAEDETARLLDNVVRLLHLVDDKDVFEEAHKAKLAKRLLTTTPNDELERAFLGKLARLVGSPFVRKFEAMLRDCELAVDMQNQFLASDFGSVDCGTDGNVAFHAHVLTSVFWPSYKLSALTLPPEVERRVQNFAAFYKAKHPHRILRWVHVLGTASLTVSFPRGTKDVQANSYQASALVLLGRHGQMSVAELAAAMQVDSQTVALPNIGSMVFSRTFPVLMRVIGGSCGEGGADEGTAASGLTEQSVVMINLDFTAKVRKFRLLPPRHFANVGARTDQEMESRRKVQIDAAIVRILKSRRTATFADVIEAVVQQLSRMFVPEVRLIKARVEDLMGRGYVSRSQQNAEFLIYEV